MPARPILAAALLAAGLPTAAAQEASYRFSPVNQWDINKTAAYWNPIIQYVSEKSGVKLQLKIGRTSADTTSYVLAQEVEFVFSNHLFSPERDALGWKVFGRRNAPALHGQIAVPAESPITKLEELKGQEVAFAGPEAFVGYKVDADTRITARVRNLTDEVYARWTSSSMLYLGAPRTFELAVQTRF